MCSSSAGRRKEGELMGLFGWCRLFGDTLGVGSWREGKSCSKWAVETVEGLSGRAGRAEAFAADDLLEFAQWEAVGGSGRQPSTCHAIWRLLICLLDELWVLRASSSAGTHSRTSGRVA